MQKTEAAKFNKLPGHLLLLAVILLAFLFLFTLTWFWYGHKIESIKDEEQRLHKKLAAFHIPDDPSYLYAHHSIYHQH